MPDLRHNTGKNRVKSGPIAGKIAIFVHPQKETPGIAAALGRDNKDYELGHSDCRRAM